MVCGFLAVDPTIPHPRAAVVAQYRCFVSAEPLVTAFPSERNDKTNDWKRDLTLSRGR